MMKLSNAHISTELSDASKTRTLDAKSDGLVINVTVNNVIAFKRNCFNVNCSLMYLVQFHGQI